jgi:thiol:disulfide interchange protein DsbD
VIFTFLALGMAAPYLLLTIFPGALRFVPKPGAWMEAFKQFMGFLLMATVIFLVYVFGALKGTDQIPSVLFVLLVSAFTAWIYGRWVTPGQLPGYRVIGLVLVTLLSIGTIGLAIMYAEAHSGSDAQEKRNTGKWQPWSQSAVDETLAKGQPVFVDFTAAWCLSCKVNETVALGTDAVKQAFEQKNVALFRADWTHSDPAISQTLQQFHRDGVPLYLLYSPKAQAAPQVLPEVLTPGIVLDALNQL